MAGVASAGFCYAGGRLQAQAKALLKDETRAELWFVERSDKAAAAGEGCAQRPEDGLARLERAADIGDGDVARRLIVWLIEDAVHDGRDHLGLFCRCALKDALCACVARRCGFAHQGCKGRDARAVRHVLLREGDDIEIVGKLEFLPYEAAQGPRRVASVALAGSLPSQPPLPSSPSS